jgi:hypothetical protein
MNIHKITLMLCLLLLTPVLTVRGAGDMNATLAIPFTVHTHGVTLTKQDLEAVLDTAQTFLQPAGVAISFDYSHSFVNYTVIDDGKISGCDDIKPLLNDKDVNVHIVDKIPCCEGPSGHETLVGCSGDHMAIIVLPAYRSMSHNKLQLTAIQWMHELGHHLGLCHNTCNDGSLMSDPLTVKDNKLDPCERRIFNGGVLTDPICISTNQSCTPLGNACQ